MKIFFFILTFFTGLIVNAQHTTLPLVPLPTKLIQHEGDFPLKKNITVYTNTENSTDWKQLFTYFQKEVNKQFGITVSVAKKSVDADIQFTLKRMPTSGKPAYSLQITKRKIEVSFNYYENGFNALQTLFQLFHHAQQNNNKLPLVEILDYPRFDYRGVHLDVARHFFSVEYLKQYLDYLAYHKINKFHWHLTEDQGWRIEIKKHPKLTTIGGYRNGTISGKYPGNGNDNIFYGGYYTQEQIKEVIAYAKERFIDVIPEFDIPGHSSAAIAVYPELSCFPEKPTYIHPNIISQKSKEELANGKIKLVQETWGVFDDILCAGNENTYAFVEDVLSEIIDLFPSKYIHIGGDEAPKTHWKACPKCQAKIKAEKLKDEHELQSYFIQRIETFVNKKGRTIIGWDEILEGGLAPNATVMSWRGVNGGIEAANQKHNAIMTPTGPLYFDYSQTKYEDSITIGGYNPLESVYNYEPIPAELTMEEAKFIIGTQANLWTEYIKNTKKIEYSMFPRLAALAEVQWTQKENKSWEGFEKRLPGILSRYEKLGIAYSKAYFDLTSKIKPQENDGVKWELSSKFEGATIRYKELGASPNNQTYTAPILIDPSKPKRTITAELEMNGKIVATTTETFHSHKAFGKKITLTDAPSSFYPGDGGFTLVNGIINQMGLNKKDEFLGFSNKDCEALIDLNTPTLIHQIIVNTFESIGSWIYPPSGFQIWASTNGEQFQQLKEGVDFTLEKTDQRKTTIKLVAEQQAQYIKIKIERTPTIPAGNPGAGSNAWLFVDEIEVY